MTVSPVRTFGTEIEMVYKVQGQESNDPESDSEEFERYEVDRNNWQDVANRLYRSFNEAGIRLHSDQITNREGEYGEWDAESEWDLTGDGSIQGLGGEIRSRILVGPQGVEELNTGFDVARKHGLVNLSCGFHVHVGADDITSSGALRLLENYSNNQKLINSVLPKSRHSTNQYCLPLPQDLSRLRGDPYTHRIPILGSRYFVVNLESISRHGTVEFRQHSGTVSKQKGVAWTMFVMALYEASVVENRSIGKGEYKSMSELTAGLGLETEYAEYFGERADYFRKIHREETE